MATTEGIREPPVRDLRLEPLAVPSVSKLDTIRDTRNHVKVTGPTSRVAATNHRSVAIEPEQALPLSAAVRRSLSSALHLRLVGHSEGLRASA